MFYKILLIVILYPVAFFAHTQCTQDQSSKPHINLSNDLPGILGLFTFDPEVASPMKQLAEILLRRGQERGLAQEGQPLSRAERELIATRVSTGNDCTFCSRAHSAIAQHLLAERQELVQAIKQNYEQATISEKLKKLLAIADKVRHSGNTVTKEDIEHARLAGATDQEIHDTVAISAIFCMYNRYVAGLNALTPDDSAIYDAMGARIAQYGYAKRN